MPTITKVGSGGATFSASWANTVSGISLGDLIIVAVGGSFDQGTWTVTDSAGNTYQSDAVLEDTSQHNHVQILSAKAAAVPTTVTVHDSTAGSNGGGSSIIYTGTGVDTSASRVDQAAALTNTDSTTPSVTTAATTNATDVAFAAFCGAAPTTASAGTGYTLLDNTAANTSRGLITEWKTTSATGAVTASITVSPSGIYEALVAVYKQAASSTNATVNAVSAQLRLRSPNPTVTTSTPATVSAPSAQLRLRSASPAVLSTSSALSGPSAQIRLRSSPPTVTTGSSATVTTRSAQIRLRAAKPSLTTTSGKSIQAPSAQLRVRAGHPSLASTSTIHGTSAQIRLRSYGVTVFASAAIPEICNPTALILTSKASTLTLTGRDTSMALTGPADTTLTVDSDDASTLILTIC